MTHTTTWFYEILKEHAPFFIKKGMTDQEYLEVIVTLLYWKYISDQAGNGNPVCQFLPERLAIDRVLRKEEASGIQALIAEALDTINSREESRQLFVNKDWISEVDKSLLARVAISFHLHFSGEWEWSNELIYLLFESIELYFSETMKTPHRYFTPGEIGLLIAQYIQPSEEASIYDPYCRDNSMFLKILAYIRQSGSPGDSSFRGRITGNADSPFNGKIARVKSLMLGLNSSDIAVRSIHDPFFKDKRFDFILSNPPYGAKPDPMLVHAGGEWTCSFAGISSEVDFLCHVIDHLSEKGSAAVIIPVGILVNKGKNAELRKKLVLSGILKTVVQLPRGIFYKTGVMTAILFLHSQENKEDILLVDATTLGSRGKDRHILSREDVDLVMEIFEKYRKGEKAFTDREKAYFCTVSPKEVESNQFDLRFTTYKPEPVFDSPRRAASGEIWKEIASLHEELEESRKEIDKLFLNNK
jgi:type I restriction-modification system DNA methylase subunit